VSLDDRSTLPTVALAVGAALARHGITAVLTGGACASLHTRGTYHSRDVDFVVTRPTTQAELDRAMASVGFHRTGDRYDHPRTAFYVEFPRGPLAIGDDYRIRPVTRRTRAGKALLLSATDSCRDRLAAFYHWNDRQSLDVAVKIALTCRVDRRLIERWSASEGFSRAHGDFLGEIARARRVRRRRRSLARARRRAV
jgi:hypothetical protein